MSEDIFGDDLISSKNDACERMGGSCPVQIKAEFIKQLNLVHYIVLKQVLFVFFMSLEARGHVTGSIVTDKIVDIPPEDSLWESQLVKYQGNIRQQLPATKW